MTENQDNKKIEDCRENLLDITIKYTKNERPKNESKNILKRLVEKLKSRKIAFTKKVIDKDKDFNTEFERKKDRKFELERYRGASMNFLSYLSFLLAATVTALMNFLGYLSFILAVIFMICFIVCLAFQQIVVYHKIIEKARKFANGEYLKN